MTDDILSGYSMLTIDCLLAISSCFSPNVYMASRSAPDAVRFVAKPALTLRIAWARKL